MVYKTLKKDKTMLGIFIILGILISIYHIAFYGETTDYTGKIFMVLASLFLISGILMYNTDTIQSMRCIALYEIVLNFVQVIDTKTISIAVETIIAIAILISSIILQLRPKLESIIKKKDNKEDKEKKASLEKESTGKKRVTVKIKPFNIPLIVKLALVIIYITLVFTLANQNIENATLLGIVYLTLPIFILLGTIIPIQDIIYIRAIYYIVWVALIQMAITGGIASAVSMAEPIVYVIASIISILQHYKLLKSK